MTRTVSIIVDWPVVASITTGVVVPLTSGGGAAYDDTALAARITQLEDARIGWTDISDVPASFPPSAHGHAMTSIAGLEGALTALSGALASKMNTTEFRSINGQAIIGSGDIVIPAGADGRDGVDGAPGAAGRDGVDGAPGADGQAGADGAPGRDGVDGAPGAAGRDGIDGAPGADGRDGIDGAPGQSITVGRFTDRAAYDAFEPDLLTLAVLTNA